jgi:hypothetical protein
VKIERAAFHFNNVEKGAAVVLYQQHAIAESQEETDALLELRQAATHDETDEDGKTTTWHSAMVTDYQQFEGLIVVPLKPIDGKENATLFSRQAMDIITEKHVSNGAATDFSFRPIDSSSDIEGGYACLGGEMNGMPCVTIASKDRQRGIIVASRKAKVINAVLDRILGQTRKGSGAAGNNKARMEQWDALSKRMEILAITVRTADQALNAITRYRLYLENTIESPNGNQQRSSLLKEGNENGR